MVAAQNEVLLLRLIARHSRQRIEAQIRWRQFNLQPRANKRAKARNRIYDRSHGLRVMSEYTDREFERAFRMSRDGFVLLLNKIRPYLRPVNDTKGKNSSGSSLGGITKLASTLRFLDMFS